MDLMEYRARELFEASGIPVLKGITVSTIEELEGGMEHIVFPAVVKAQVQTGGRGKRGGIQFADNPIELRQVVGEILGMNINGHIVEKVMIVEKAEIERELYLSILLDRNSKKHIIIFSPCGGMDIEQTAKTAPDQIYRLEIDPLLGFSKPDGIYLGGKAGLSVDGKKQLAGLIIKLYTLCKSYDCMLAEINPLAVTKAGNLLALDAKVSIDDSALPRLPDMAAIQATIPTAPLVKEAAGFNFLYIPCEETGNIVVMSNGSGMLMSCIDHIAKRGMTVSAVLDLGGGATAERIQHAVRILLSTPGAEMLFINIFGGITRCDEVAAGIRAAVEHHQLTHPIIVRFEGTNKEKGLEIIEGLENVVYADGLLSGVEEIVKRGSSK